MQSVRDAGGDLAGRKRDQLSRDLSRKEDDRGVSFSLFGAIHIAVGRCMEKAESDYGICELTSRCNATVSWRGTTTVQCTATIDWDTLVNARNVFRERPVKNVRNKPDV